jgi:ABC-2 type transport system permease protein
MKKLANLYSKDVILGVKDVFIILELSFSVVILLLLLFVIPSQFDTEGRVYILDETKVLQNYIEEFIPDIEEQGEFFVASRSEIIEGITENTNAIGIHIKKMKDGVYPVEMLHQPYTKQAAIAYVDKDLKDLLSILTPGVYSPEVYTSIRIEAMSRGERDVLPFNKVILAPLLLQMIGVLGLFSMLSLIGQERMDLTLKAYRLTPAGLPLFLLSKHLVLLSVSIITFSIIYLPIIGFSGYFSALGIILLTVLFGSSVGIILGTWYETPMSAIGWVFVLLLILMMPAISLFNPAFSPEWMRFIPSFYTIFGLDAAIFPNGDTNIIPQSFLILGVTALLSLPLSAWIFTNQIRKEA